MSTITQNLLKEIFTKTCSYCLSHLGEEPNRVEISEDGFIYAVYISNTGEENKTEIITVDNLNLEDPIQ